MPRRRKRTFTDEFRTDAVRLCQAGDRSIPQVAKDLNLTVTVLHDWVRNAEAKSGPSIAQKPLTNDERGELAELRKRVKRLKMGREILRKAAVHSTGRCNTMQLIPAKGTLGGDYQATRSRPR